MKIRATYTAISRIPQAYKNECRNGQWSNWSRVFIFNIDNRYSVVTANMLERFMATFLKIFHVDYYKLKLGGRVKVLRRGELNVTDSKISPTIKPNPIAPGPLLHAGTIPPESPAVKQAPAAPAIAPPPNLPAVATPAMPSVPAAQQIKTPTQKPAPQLHVQPKNILASNLDPTQLTAEQIKRMSPDQQGALIDNFARRSNAGSNLSQAQLKGMLRSQNRGSVQIINKQELGLGHCGRYCINNALQRGIPIQREFSKTNWRSFCSAYRHVFK